MAFGGYTYEGFRDRADELDAQRMNVAKAFEQFKKDNPYATAQELQSHRPDFWRQPLLAFRHGPVRRSPRDCPPKPRGSRRLRA